MQWVSLTLKYKCSANWLQYVQHNCYCHWKTNNNWERLTLAHTAKKVEGVNNSNNNLLIENTWKQPLSIMLHNYVPLLKYKYWIKITIVSTHCNNSKRSIKQIGFADLEHCLNSLKLYDVTMHKKSTSKKSVKMQCSKLQSTKPPDTH